MLCHAHFARCDSVDQDQGQLGCDMTVSRQNLALTYMNKTRFYRSSWEQDYGKPDDESALLDCNFTTMPGITWTCGA